MVVSQKTATAEMLVFDTTLFIASGRLHYLGRSETLRPVRGRLTVCRILESIGLMIPITTVTDTLCYSLTSCRSEKKAGIYIKKKRDHFGIPLCYMFYQLLFKPV